MEKKKQRGLIKPAFVGWVGAALMVAFSFTLILPFGILGLTCLTVQAVSAKLHNLVILNLLSLVGLFINLLSPFS